MENNKLVKTDTIWYKIKRIFLKLFTKKQTNVIGEKNIKGISNEDFINRISVMKQLREETRRENLAVQLLNDEIDIYDLTDEQVVEMLEWFKKDIEEKECEINSKQKRILQMQKELEEEKRG